MPASILSHWRRSPSVIRVGSRRWFLEVSAAGMLGMPGLGRPPVGWTADQLGNSTSTSSTNHRSASHSGRSVILIWLSGGPSHLDMWDPKPDAPVEIRGPFGTIPTTIPGVRLCEHFPQQADLAQRLTLIRSVDCRASDHTPITMQAGNPLARRTNDGKDGAGYPAMGAVAARYGRSHQPNMPPFVGLADSWVSDIWEAGDLGHEYAPVNGRDLVGKFGMPAGVSVDRLQDRQALRTQLNQLGHQLDGVAAQRTSSLDRYVRQAHEMVLSGKVDQAFRLDQETDTTRDAYGRHSLGEKTLLARRLVESGVTFVVVSGAWGYFDHHGDNVQWGGIVKGLKPLLPQVDQTLCALVTDLEQRGLLDSTLIMMLGEFGRAPRINADAGRDHWTNVMSMVMAGGGLRHGQVIGSTDRQGGSIASSPVRPQDIAATTFQHLGIDLSTTWTNRQGRPIPIVCEGGRPIPELTAG